MTSIKLFFIMMLSAFHFASCSEIENELCFENEGVKTERFEGIDLYKNIDDAIKCSSIKSKPLFIIFTCYGNPGSSKEETFEQKLFKSRRFRKLISSKFIPVVLYVDISNKLEEMQISIRNGSEYKLRTEGNVNADYQIRKMQSNSTPQLAILDPKGEEVISQMGFVHQQKEYFLFLKDGLEKHEAKHGKLIK